MHVEAHVRQVRDDGLHLFVGRALFHDHNHDVLSSAVRRLF
jgi:hypothetical protein